MKSVQEATIIIEIQHARMLARACPLNEKVKNSCVLLRFTEKKSDSSETVIKSRPSLRHQTPPVSSCLNLNTPPHVGTATTIHSPGQLLSLVIIPNVR